MAGLRIGVLVAMAPCLAAAAFWLGDARAAECKRKTAGFYLEETSAGRSLVRSPQNLPGSLTGVPGDVSRGQAVLVSRQRGDCLSCHKVSALASVPGQGEIGPALDGVGAKYSDAQLRQILIEPKAYFPETIMPSYHRVADSQASVLTAAEIEDLVAFLKILK